MVTASRPADSSSSRSKRLEGEQGREGIANLQWKLSQMKKQVKASRLVYIKEKIERNRKNLQIHTCKLFDVAAAAEAATRSSSRQSKGENMLSSRMGNALCTLSGWDVLNGTGEKEVLHIQEEIQPSGTLVIGNNGGNKSVLRLLKLPFVEKIPPYTTWIFLDKNQRMAEDQSVVGRRRIYYDSVGNEALVCSDTDEEIQEPEEEKHEFSEGEDQILWKAIHEHGTNQEVLNIVRQFIDGTQDEIEDRYELLLAKHNKEHKSELKISDEKVSEERSFVDKTLNEALDSFDNLFCRRCLIFDCRLHGCSQNLIIPSEKQCTGLDLEENRKPCGDQCYLRRKGDSQAQTSPVLGIKPTHDIETKAMAERFDTLLPSESEDSNPDESIKLLASEKITDAKRTFTSSETSDGSNRQNDDDTDDIETSSEVPLRNLCKRKTSKDGKSLLGEQLASEEIFIGSNKKRKKPSCSVVGLINEVNSQDRHPNSASGSKSPDFETSSHGQNQEKVLDESVGHHTRKDVHAGNISNTIEEIAKGTDRVTTIKASSSRNPPGWSTMEKDLYLKGIEIFGENCCLIARNLLSGLKTCMEVACYMASYGTSLTSRPMLANSYFDDGKADLEHMEQEMPTRTRMLRRRGKARKLKYTWKSAGYPYIRKRIADGKQQSCKQYTPCGCQQMCGKLCPCMHNGTCCEKYCGCSKGCKNRFRGCHCAKSQCRSRQCPCFAAGRECDPDVCRNCWVSCGDGSLGEPPARGDGYQCGNMKLLLKQQERILLARSDVAGWGAFIRNPVNKNDYLGEYTGELISHREADKRGKIYDRANSSFLFDLNDQFVLDAYRKGDKLKFANHSSNPNCYAKVMLVAGDHRVGIFAKEHIEAGEELFYDYRYGPDQAPAWARKPEGSKRDDSSVSHSRAHKVA
ncbi:histone-lysine N-methyltransferase EZ3-like isoform X1 [Zingiber officinale]|uniref:histone-lysine N-methyltransferase EZ3-like isoform X1 n=1 Tax=Zingiber officinale TaxID=94328 RepID=UPI001C4BAC0F|nr:histone-lysine N-methyltransferase EZ3-like isoform X1 [Zingiber officinale]